ncbi:alpha/beta hydrolase [Daejeonella sp.]|uniref:alpha/beta fold hydrolase n=1 Tax=Daejeonella sp. TaxID=2805397 RepID=UPI0030BD6C00
MTDHYFEHPLVQLHYYKFGSGPKHMFCFHGYGMHGKQFILLEKKLGDQYTFYGFDLFFHKETRLQDQSLDIVRRGITKAALGKLFADFCEVNNIDKFSAIAYSMGSHYATSLVEEIPEHVDELFIAAPSSLKPGRILRFLSSNRVGNKMLERMALSDKGLIGFLAFLKKAKIIDQHTYNTLFKEICSPELRFSFYACASYMRFLDIDPDKFISQLNRHNIRSVFIFGERDKNYPVGIASAYISKINLVKQVVINENHDMINRNFAQVLADILDDH